MINNKIGIVVKWQTWESPDFVGVAMCSGSGDDSVADDLLFTTKTTISSLFVTHFVERSLTRIANWDHNTYLCTELTFRGGPPWWGGMFERLIRSVKRCLRKIIGQARLSYNELTTAIVEVEAVINSRPLTYVATDNLDEPLTPSHLLTGCRILSLPDYLCHKPEEENETPDIGHSQLTRRACHLNNTLDSFRRHWRKEYLLELRES